MRTLLEIVNLSTEYLKDKGIANPRREAQDLICDAMGLDRVKLYMEHDRPLIPSEIDLLRKRIARRAQGEPGAYIHGEMTFYKCSIAVNADVLIPRQETEILVDKIAQDLRLLGTEDKVLWDMCCGSGCIGIALKKTFPALTVVLSDVCEKALAIAKSNALRNQVEVEFVHGDLFAHLVGRLADYVVCNPPYISEQEYVALDWEVRGFEPHKALVAGKTGLEFYIRLAKDLPSHLKPGGRAWFELGTGQGEALLEMFQGPPWKEARVEKDWAGHDRFFFLEKFS